jgi:F0F1-type ATP synthase assembly protein I
MMWSSRITSIGFQFAVPVGFGWWLDRRWGTEPWLMVVGALLGFLTGTLALVQLAKDSARAEK